MAKAHKKNSLLPVTAEHLRNRLKKRSAMYLGIDIETRNEKEWKSICDHMLALVKSGAYEDVAVDEACGLCADYVLHGPDRYSEKIRDRAIDVKVMESKHG